MFSFCALINLHSFPTRRSSDLHAVDRDRHRAAGALLRRGLQHQLVGRLVDQPAVLPAVILVGDELRSEEHTSELQSLTNLVCRLLLEKKKLISLAMQRI